MRKMFSILFAICLLCFSTSSLAGTGYLDVGHAKMLDSYDISNQVAASTELQGNFAFSPVDKCHINIGAEESASYRMGSKITETAYKLQRLTYMSLGVIERYDKPYFF